MHGKKGNYGAIHPNDDVNMGQSTNNVMPCAIKMTVFERNKKLLPEIKKLEKLLKKKSVEFKKTIKSGRTHLQDAVPITLGQEFHAYATMIQKNIVRIQKSSRALLELNTGGNAVGTGINREPKKTLSKPKRFNTVTTSEYYGSNPIRPIIDFGFIAFFGRRGLGG